MAVELETSAIMETVRRITAAPGSPYFGFEVIIKAGGKDIVPFQMLRLDTGRNYRDSYMDATTLVLAIGLGTLVNEISPFQDDLKIIINQTQCDEYGRQYTDLPVLSRTFRAYLGDEVPRSLESGGNSVMQDTETANRASIKNVRFVLEEVAIEQLRKFPVGVIPRGHTPFDVMKTLLIKASQALKLGKDEVIGKFEFTEPNNVTPRDHIVIKDGEYILNVPDLLQNKQGGIYSTGLGFYIQDRGIYTWPMYDTTRQATAKRVLEIVLAPNRYSKILDRTWMDDGRKITVYSAGVSKVIDDSLGKLNIEGNGVRFAAANKLLDGFVSVANNKATVSRTKNNSEYTTAVVGNGQNFAPVAKNGVSGNIYLETSKLAKRNGAILITPWRRSHPEKLTPGMAVEVLYDYAGVIRTIEGTLLETVNSYTLDGEGTVADRYFATTAISVFIDRSDPDYIDFMKSGGQISPIPEVGTI